MAGKKTGKKKKPPVRPWVPPTNQSKPGQKPAKKK